MGAYDYGMITQLTNQEARATYAGATAGAALLSGERFPVGTLGTTQDGRWYRFAQDGTGAALVAGSIYTGPVLQTNHVNNTATATAAGATSVTFTQGGTAITRNFYKGGQLIVDVTPGGGYTYGVDAHDAVGSATANTYPLAPGESIQVALTTTSRVSLISTPFRNLVIAPTTTLAAAVAGVAVSLIAISGFGWIQTKGAASVLTEGTFIIGNMVMSPSTTVAGAATPGGATEAVNNISWPIGTVLRVGANGGFSLINLNIV